MMYWGYLDSEDKTPPVIVTISALFSRISFIWPAMLNVLIKKKQGNLILSNFFCQSFQNSSFIQKKPTKQ
jgi:hypothetical protein